MYKFLTSKKGFTLVELLIVVILLSLGVLALANLFKVGYRAFEKSSERHMKQETVRQIAEYLQKVTKIDTATKCSILSSADYVPSGENTSGYAYLYAEFEEHTEDPKLTGYYLKVLEKKGKREEVQCLNEGVPLYIVMKPILDETTNTLAAGVEIQLSAVESDFVYVKDEGTEKYNSPTDDEIFYELNVAYHFPNMVERYMVTEYEPNGDETVAQLKAQDCYALKLTLNSGVVGDESKAHASAHSFCFIATASYGKDSGEVGLLCEFRDKCLLTNPLGTAFVKAYYKLSPPIADFIRESEPLKAAVRIGLKPLILIATNALDENVASQSAPWFIMFMLCGAGATATLIKIDKRKKKIKD